MNSKVVDHGFRKTNLMLQDDIWEWSGTYHARRAYDAFNCLNKHLLLDKTFVLL